MAFQCIQVFQTLLKLSVQFLLLGLFVYFFGEPAVSKYLDKKVLVVKSRQNTKGTTAPAVTIVVWDNETQCGWKEKGPFGCVGSVQELCNEANNTETITGCIQKNTYNLSEIIKSVKIASNDFYGSREVKSPTWKEDFTHIYAGRIYTIDHPVKLKVYSPSENALHIELATFGPEYEIYIHDPAFFYITRNSESGHPNIWMRIDIKRKGGFMHPIALTQVEELNVPEDPCIEDPNYNFRKCLKESFLRKIGCKTKWDDGILEDLPLCASQQQFR